MNKKAIVTGANSGIGKGIATALAREGYDVAISYAHKKEEALAVVAQLKAEYGVNAYCFQASLDVPGASTAFFRQATEALGGLDLLVNNAGLTMCESIYELTEETLDHLLNLDFRSFVLMMRDATQYMIDHKTKGAIINITSSRGERARLCQKSRIR